MIPILIERGYDLTPFFTSDGKAFFTNDNQEFLVLNENASIPENNGVGLLSSAISCNTHRFDKLGWELEMEYPIDGLYFNEIKLRDIIVAEADPVKGNQPFRIYKISSPLGGICTIYAYHLIYDLIGIPVSPFKADNIQSALDGVKRNAMVGCPFHFFTTRTTDVPFELKSPKAVWNLLAGDEGSILDIYTGEYDIDGYYIALENKVGEDRGVTAKYGVNLIDLKQEESCANCYTGIVGYYESDEQTSFTPIIKFEGDFDYTKILTQDMSSYFDYMPSMSELTDMTIEYAKENELSSPAISWDVKFIQLSKTVNYKDIAELDKVGYGDTVNVYLEKLNINASARVVETEYNSLLEQYESINLGSKPETIAVTIANQQSAIENSVTRHEVSSTITNTIEKGISADNIVGGTLRVGGAENTRGCIHIYDENDVLSAIMSSLAISSFDLPNMTYDGMVSGSELRPGDLGTTRQHWEKGESKGSYPLAIFHNSDDIDFGSMRLYNQNLTGRTRTVEIRGSDGYIFTIASESDTTNYNLLWSTTYLYDGILANGASFSATVPADIRFIVVAFYINVGGAWDGGPYNTIIPRGHMDNREIRIACGGEYYRVKCLLSENSLTFTRVSGGSGYVYVRGLR